MKAIRHDVSKDIDTVRLQCMVARSHGLPRGTLSLGKYNKNLTIAN